MISTLLLSIQVFCTVPLDYTLSRPNVAQVQALSYDEAFAKKSSKKKQKKNKKKKNKKKTKTKR